MVEKSETDGKRIAELLSSELTGHENAPFDRLAVANADPDVEPTTDGARAYDVEADGERLASVYVQPDRARVELVSGLDAAREAAESGGLRTRPVGGEPPRLVVFVESGVDAKRALDAVGAATMA
ncbi:hypothetical protein [Halobacterium litoreum]|uniref:DUF7993 domain-containing protein n=1 Tax=Halobacterium litoreum TaxID=2039234 RepID=A0ABD5ND70_9EURY|nr:hypothetical protein [Halobacterium litoreum]UHH14009.1 hypothetical protein LT972_03175 [Halobacterium litoreum]